MKKTENKIIIYRIQILKDGINYVYIGQTKRTIEEREKEHRNNAGNNQPSSLYEFLGSIPSRDWPNPLLYKITECDIDSANKEEKKWIKEYAQYPNINILNDSHTKKIKENKKNIIDYGMRGNHKPCLEKTAMGVRFLKLSNKIKPVINLATKKEYISVSEAAKFEKVSLCTIKLSCNTGKKLENHVNYAYIDLDGTPILTEGHNQNNYIGKNAKKIKELISGQIFNNANEVAKKYNLSLNSISGYVSGKYGIAKKQYVFCYLNKNNNEIRLHKHNKAIEIIQNRNIIKYVAWPVSFTYEQAKIENQISYFKSLKDLYKSLKIKNKSHVKSVCDGKRSHVEKYRIANYDAVQKEPILHSKHLEKSKKIITPVYCVNDGQKFPNYTEAGKYYSINANQIRQCAKGILKSVRKKMQNKAERLQFQDLDKSGNPIMPDKHREPMTQRKGVSSIMLINQDVINKIGRSKFSSIAEYCRETGVPPKRARKYKNEKNKITNLDGYEFVEIPN